MNLPLNPKLLYSYKMGFDCAMYGPNEKNSDPKLFINEESYQQWKLGRDKAVEARFSGKLP